MSRLRLFDKALYFKQIGGNGILVIIDVCYLISSVFWGFMSLHDMLLLIGFVNVVATCILYHNFIVSRGEMSFELNTEKIVYFPTTRYEYLWNKYTKTIHFIMVQFILTLACLGLAYMGSSGDLSFNRVIASSIIVCSAIIFTSGIAIQVMHIMPLGIYLSMLIIFPFRYVVTFIVEMIENQWYIWNNIYLTLLIIGSILLLIWLILLWIGGKISERIG